MRSESPREIRWRLTLKLRNREHEQSLSCRLMQRSHAEGNLHYGFDGDGFAVLCAGAEAPVREGANRVLIQARIQAAKHANIIYRAVRADDGIERHSALHVIAQYV